MHHHLLLLSKREDSDAGTIVWARAASLQEGSQAEQVPRSCGLNNQVVVSNFQISGALAA
jgi:hypothetical protein